MIKAKAISGSVLPTHPTKLLRDRDFPGEAELNFVLNGIVERNAAGTSGTKENALTQLSQRYLMTLASRERL